MPGVGNRVLAEQYAARPRPAAEVAGHCVGISNLGEGRLAWTIHDKGVVECWDIFFEQVEWSVGDCGTPYSVTLVNFSDQFRAWVTDTSGDRVLFLDAASGQYEGQLPFPGSPTGAQACGKPMSQPHGIASFTDDSDVGACRVWVADTGNNRLLGFDVEHCQAAEAIGEDILDQPLDVAALSEGRIACVCRCGGSVFAAATGTLLFRFNEHFMIANALSFDPRGSRGGLISAMDEYTDRLLIFCGSTGEHLRTLKDFGVGIGTGASKGLVFVHGDEGAGHRVFVADGVKHRIVSLDVGPQSKPATPAMPFASRPKVAETL